MQTPDLPADDRVVTGESKYPVAIDVEKVGSYPALVKSGAGYFYDDVLEYRVWLHPERGAQPISGDDDYFVSFAQYERALDFSNKSAGAEKPLVLVRQLKHINEPSPGVFEIAEGERIAEWNPDWLAENKRKEGSLERFLEEHKK
ncbi:MAG: hypothetical protein ACKVP0_19685 [Pirellulaceae bacterium]